MSQASLADALFTPRSIALIGASDKPGVNNSRTQVYLEKHGYQGKVYPVHPTRDTVYGVKCYPSVKDIPDQVDHAFITTPPAVVPQVIRECGEANVPVATVFTSDFAESGDEGARLQEELIDAAKKGGVRLIGPNCMGVYNTDPPATIAPNSVLQLPVLNKGNLGVISHSGSLTGTFISRGQARGLGFSKIVSIGNESDISVAEVGEILVDDPKTEAILLFLETIRSGEAFAAMARRAYDAGKPIIVYKLGRSEAAQQFTASHTGAIAGTDAGIAAFRTPEGCADAFRCCLSWQPPVPAPAVTAFDGDGLAALVNELPAGTADEESARTIFHALGVPQVAAATASDADAGLAMAASVGFPMVAKILSPDIAHKTEAGGVELNIADPEALATALSTIQKRVTDYNPSATLNGFLLQRMERGLAEVLLGYRVDSLVGPTVVLGAGGVLSEIYGDIAIRIAPVSVETAREMIAEVDGLAPIRGYRGMPKGDLNALADAIVAVSNLARLNGSRISEAEINPLLVKPDGDGVVAVDGLIVTDA